MSDILINTRYAPGIPTYGIHGKQGDIGKPGYSLYFVPYSDGIGSETLKNNIKNNIFLSDINLDLASKYMVDRKYQSGDLFLTITGKIYRLIDINPVTFDETPIMNIFLQLENIFNISDNVISNLPNYKTILSNDSIKDSSSLGQLNIQAKDNNYITLISNDENKQKMTIKDISSGIMFDSSLLVIPNLLISNNDEYNSEIYIDGNVYNKVITVNNSEVIANDKSIYTIDGDKLIINGSEENIMFECKYIINNDPENIIHSQILHNNEFDMSDKFMVELYLHKNEYISKYFKIKPIKNE